MLECSSIRPSEVWHLAFFGLCKPEKAWKRYVRKAQYVLQVWKSRSSWAPEKAKKAEQLTTKLYSKSRQLLYFSAFWLFISRQKVKKQGKANNKNVNLLMLVSKTDIFLMHGCLPNPAIPFQGHYFKNTQFPFSQKFFFRLFIFFRQLNNIFICYLL